MSNDAELLRLLEAERTAICEASLAEFVRDAWHVIEPTTPLVWNWHMDVLCEYIQAFFERRVTRLILNVPPGCMKSILFSVMGPAWKWARDPSARIVSLTNEIGLATRDNRRMRQIIESDWYRGRWGHKVTLAKDQSEKTLFENTARGFRQGLGLTGNITGKRGDFLLIDDPVDAKKAFSDTVIVSANNTYDQAVSSRLNDPANDCIGLIMQRLRTNDLTGHLAGKKATNWVVVRIPMEWDGCAGYDPVADLGPEYAHLADPRRTHGELMFPARFPARTVESLKEDLTEYGAAGQLQQRPSPLGGGILKSMWWRIWPDDKPKPKCEHVFLSWDTAYTADDLKTNSYSAMTAWGVFWFEPEQRYCLLLLRRWYDRADYPTLRAKAKALHVEMQPDCQLIEKKASGQSLVQDLRRARIKVRTYNPDRDKVARAYAVSAMLQSGQIWAPERKWADEVITQVAAFPNGAPPSADLTDTCTQAWLYLRNGWWVSHPDDDDKLAPPKSANDQENENENDARAAY